MPLIAPASLRKAREQHYEYVTSATADRIAKGADSERRDFMSYILDGKTDLTFTELVANCDVFLIASSETVATVLSVCTSSFLEQPRTLQKAVDEVRAAFDNKEEITVSAVYTQLPYLRAALSEAMRIRPCAAGRFPRRVPKDTAITVAGHHVPPDTTVNVHQLTIATSADYFHKPEVFAPERWLPKDATKEKEGHTGFENDRLDASQPFIMGPRDCMGRNLSWNSMLLVLARLLWSFDLVPVNKDSRWIDTMTTQSFWQRQPLPVRLTRVHR
jgi:cytochrome P450